MSLHNCLLEADPKRVTGPGTGPGHYTEEKFMSKSYTRIPGRYILSLFISMYVLLCNLII